MSRRFAGLRFHRWTSMRQAGVARLRWKIAFQVVTGRFSKPCRYRRGALVVVRGARVEAQPEQSGPRRWAGLASLAFPGLGALPARLGADA